MKTSIKQDLFQLFTGGKGEREREIVSAKADSCLAGSQTQLNVHPVLSGTQCNYSTLQTSNYHHAHTEMPDSQEQSFSSLWPKWSSNISLYALFDVFRLNIDDFVTLWSILHGSLQDEPGKPFPPLATGWRSGSMNRFWKEWMKHTMASQRKERVQN